jgi:hypothetical protein
LDACTTSAATPTGTAAPTAATVPAGTAVVTTPTGTAASTAATVSTGTAVVTTTAATPTAAAVVTTTTATPTAAAVVTSTAPPTTAGVARPAHGTERLVLAIGQISASYRTVLTPSGSAPVNAVTWSIREDLPGRGRVWRRASSGDSAASLVLLTVTVTGPGWQHVERVGPATAEEAAAVRARVTQARMLALRAVVWPQVRAVQRPQARVRDEVAEPAR